MDALQLREQVDGLLQHGRYDEIQTLLLSNKRITERDNGLAALCYLYTVYEQEVAAGQATIFSKVTNLEELLERYTVLKFYLRRIEFDVMENLQEFYQFLTQNRISTYELLRVMEFSVVNREKVLQTMGGTGQEKRTGPTEKVQECQAEACDAQTICFIICSNDAVYTAECMYYIRHLIVPEGFRIAILTVEDAGSMAAGYNEAMRYSKAKYKVYLHQDTFLINKHFIQEILSIFRSDERIGMIGVIGTPNMPEDGTMWKAKRYGMIYEQHIYETVLLSGPCVRQLEDVEAVDGLLMITQYDTPWREDLFDKWDFYDCSQSMEFIRRGHRVVVPKMDVPWCVHDCGFLNLENFEEERRKYVAEYGIDRK